MSSPTVGEGQKVDKLTLRVKCKLSQNITLRDISATKNCEEFLRDLSNLTTIPHDKMTLLRGFPPKRIPYDYSMTLQSMGIINQDTIIVEQDKAGPLLSQVGSSQPLTSLTSSPQTSSLPPDGPSVAHPSSPYSLKDTSNPLPQGPARRGPEPIPASEDAVRTNFRGPARAPPDFLHGSSRVNNAPLGSTGVMMRKVVASDNSCLFSAITFCMTGAEGVSSGDLRELIATTVLSDPMKYNEGYLGRSNLEYVEWISRYDSWGGGIELAIISEFYSCEINVMDTQHMRINRFGEDRDYSTRIFLIYDGIHYDALYLECYDGSGIVTKFPASDTSIYDQVMDLGREANAAHQYTDVKNFTLRCEDCNSRFHGTKEADAHAQSTGHKNFVEYK